MNFDQKNKKLKNKTNTKTVTLTEQSKSKQKIIGKGTDWLEAKTKSIGWRQKKTREWKIVRRVVRVVKKRE